MNPRPRLSLSAAGRAAGFTLGCRGVADVRARERETEGARGPWGTGVSHRGRSETGRGCAAPEARPGWRGIERPPTPPTGAAPPYSRTPPHLPTQPLSILNQILLRLRTSGQQPAQDQGHLSTAATRAPRGPARRGAVGARGGQLPRSFLGRDWICLTHA